MARVQRAALCGVREANGAGNRIVFRCRLPRDRVNPSSEVSPFAVRRRFSSVVLFSTTPMNPPAGGAPAILLLPCPKSTQTRPRKQIPRDEAAARSHPGPPPTEVTSSVGTVRSPNLEGSPWSLRSCAGPQAARGLPPSSIDRDARRGSRLPPDRAAPVPSFSFSGAPYHLCFRRFRKTLRGC